MLPRRKRVPADFIAGELPKLIGAEGQCAADLRELGIDPHKIPLIVEEIVLLRAHLLLVAIGRAFGGGKTSVELQLRTVERLAADASMAGLPQRLEERSRQYAAILGGAPAERDFARAAACLCSSVAQYHDTGLLAYVAISSEEIAIGTQEALEALAAGFRMA